jgi:hypothetical protein
MGKLDKLIGSKDARQKLKDARRALEDNSEREMAAGIRDETDEFNRLNNAVIDAEKNVPWLGR